MPNVNINLYTELFGKYLFVLSSPNWNISAAQFLAQNLLFWNLLSQLAGKSLIVFTL